MPEAETECLSSLLQGLWPSLLSIMAICFSTLSSDSRSLWKHLRPGSNQYHSCFLSLGIIITIWPTSLNPWSLLYEHDTACNPSECDAQRKMTSALLGNQNIKGRWCLSQLGAALIFLWFLSFIDLCFSILLGISYFHSVLSRKQI